MSQEFRVKNIDEVGNYLLEEIKQNALMSRKHKKVCTTLNYIEFWLRQLLDVFQFLLLLLGLVLLWAIFYGNTKDYVQIFLDECLYKMYKWKVKLNEKKLLFSWYNDR